MCYIGLLFYKRFIVNIQKGTKKLSFLKLGFLAKKFRYQTQPVSDKLLALQNLSFL